MGVLINHGANSVHGGLRPGLLEMIEHIHDDATDVLALIHDSVATKDPPEKRIETRGRAVAAAPRSGNKQGS